LFCKNRFQDKLADSQLVIMQKGIQLHGVTLPNFLTRGSALSPAGGSGPDLRYRFALRASWIRQWQWPT